MNSVSPSTSSFKAKYNITDYESKGKHIDIHLPSCLAYNNPMIHRFGFNCLSLLLVGLLIFSGWKNHYEEIADVKNLSQDPASYISRATANQRILSHTEQQHLYLEFLTQYFGPWKRRSPGYSKKDATWAFQEFRNQTGWNEIKQKIDPSWIDELEANAGLETFPNKRLRGINTQNTHLRMLPTEKPFFYSFDLDGEGFPFDNLQHSNLPANTPLFVSHVSKDGAWSLVESHYGLGWVPTETVAFVDQNFIDRWQTGNYISLVNDQVPLVTIYGTYLFKSSIGSQFPAIGETEDSFEIYASQADIGRQARLLKVKVSKKDASPAPVPLTPYYLATVAKKMVGIPYGWGGMYANRDCSSLTKDFLSVFGIYLPTNSIDQSRYGRGFENLEGLSHEGKKQVILRDGIPFLTLLWMKGHIMLYIGQSGGEPIVMHSTWGIRTRDWFNPDGRHLVAKTVITTLEAGKELENHNPDSLLINRLQKMTFLVDRSR